MSILGRDLKAVYRVTDGRFEDLDLQRKPRSVLGGKYLDLIAVEGVENAVQAVINRIKTFKGELAPLGHPEYGSRHHELIGQPNNEHNRNLVKLYILQALSYEPRIEKMEKALIGYDRQRMPESMKLLLVIRFVESGAAVELTVPFNFTRGII